MSNLLLSDDDIGLLRWTCELFFVPESPLFHLEASGHEPRDFAQTYHDLVRKGVLDEASFRLTDPALNRLAPLSECDARIVLVLPGDRDRLRVRNYHLLDEIAVEYEAQDHLHSIGPDQDQAEFVASLAKRFMPRRAGGDFLDLALMPAEFLMMAVLCHHARRGETVVPVERLVEELRPALAEGRPNGLTGARRQAKETSTPGRRPPEVRHRAAALLAVPGHEPSPVQDATARSAQPVARPPGALGMGDEEVTQPAGRVPAPQRVVSVAQLEEETQRDLRTRRSGRATETAQAEKALKGLLEEGVVRQGAHGVELRPAVATLALGLTERARHTFVRFDFTDEDWIIRETSFLSVEGSLYVVAAEDGMLNVVELDGRRLEAWLSKAVGPLPPLAPESGPGKSAREFLLRA